MYRYIMIIVFIVIRYLVFVLLFYYKIQITFTPTQKAGTPGDHAY